MRRPAALAPLALALVLALPAAAQETRELGAHEHGQGSLRIAVEGREVALELEAPGVDIVGFEHAAESEADRMAAEAARDALSNPLELFVLPEQAGCETTSAEVELTGHGNEAHGEGEHGDGEPHDDEEHRDEEHAEDGQGGHSEFHAEYRLTCADPSAIGSIGFPYFATFPNARELEVQVVSDRGARSFEVERDEPTLGLDGGL